VRRNDKEEHVILRRSAVIITVSVCALVFASAAGVLAQEKPAATPDPKALAAVAGKYTGTASTPQGEMPFTAELKVDGTSVTGSIGAGDFVLPITAGTLDGSTLTLTLDMNGNAMTLSGTFKDGRFQGTGSMGGGPVVMAKVTEAGAAAATPGAKPVAAAPAAGADPISGEWDGLVDAPDQQRPFTLKIKLDGEKVTGEVGAEMGTTALQSGTYSGGNLNVAFPFTTGDTITMTGTVQDGKLVGQMTVGTMGTFPWVAVRKK
jgi:hypothetical protein